MFKVSLLLASTEGRNAKQNRSYDLVFTVFGWLVGSSTRSMIWSHFEPYSLCKLACVFLCMYTDTYVYLYMYTYLAGKVYGWRSWFQGVGGLGHIGLKFRV